MDDFENNALKIADYLENKMTQEEEKNFMIEISNNIALRQQYEDELYITGLLSQQQKSGALNDLMLQPADEHIEMIEAAINKKIPGKEKAPVISILSRYRNIAAIFFVIIAVTSIYYLTRKWNLHTDDLTKLNNQNKLPVAVDSGNKSKLVIAAQHMTTDSAFKNFYKKYTSENGPVEISYYYTQYKNGKYAKVLSAKGSDFQLMGTNDKQEVLKQYMDLYKGLSFLAQEKPVNAIEHFDSVLKSSSKTSDQYYQAQWYKMLSYLKNNNVKKALESLQVIKLSASPYNKKAMELIKDLN